MYFSKVNGSYWDAYMSQGMDSVVAYGGELMFFGSATFPFNSASFGESPFGRLGTSEYVGMIKWPSSAVAKAWYVSPEYNQMKTKRLAGSDAIFSLFESVMTGVLTQPSDLVVISGRIKNQTASDKYDAMAFPAVLGFGAQVIVFSGQQESITYLTDKQYAWSNLPGSKLELVLQFPVGTALPFFTNQNSSDQALEYSKSKVYRDEALEAIYAFVDTNASTTIPPPPAPPAAYMNMYFQVTNLTYWGAYATGGMTSVTQYGGVMEFFGACNFSVNDGSFGGYPFETYVPGAEYCGTITWPSMDVAKQWYLSAEYGQMISIRNNGANAIFSLYTSVFGTGYFTAQYDKVLISARIMNQTASDKYDAIAFPAVTAVATVCAFSGQLPSMTFLTEKRYGWYAWSGSVLEMVLEFLPNTAEAFFLDSNSSAAAADYAASIIYRNEALDAVYGFVVANRTAA